MFEWWTEQHWAVRFGVALAFLGFSAILYFGFGIIWFWSWGVGGVLLLFALLGGWD